MALDLKINIRVKRIYLFVLGIVLISFIITKLFGAENAGADGFVTTLVLFAGTIWILSEAVKAKKNERIALISAYILRVFLLILALEFGIRIFVLSSDSEMFYKTALDYHNRIPTTGHSNYEHFLNAIMQIFGTGRFVPQYLNILFWYAGWKVIHSIIPMSLPKRNKQYIMAIYFFLPISIFMTTELLRESLMMLLIMLSFRYLIQWMKGGHTLDFKKAIVISMLSIFLHPVSFAMIGGCFAALVFWDRKKQNWNITLKKTGVILAVGICCYIILHFKLYAAFGYFPNDISLESMTNRSFYSGRSDYLVGVNVTTIPQFLFWTVIRSFYFWFSPIVTDWNSAIDLIGVLIDVIPITALFFMLLKGGKKAASIYKIGVVILLLFTFLYCWGTGNAGTAMRHRNMLIGVMIMTYSLKYSDERSVKHKNGKQ